MADVVINVQLLFENGKYKKTRRKQCQRPTPNENKRTASTYETSLRSMASIYGDFSVAVICAMRCRLRCYQR